MTYDVVVVGAGPAGSTIAKIVAERGFKVLVLEKYTLDREKPCGGAISNRVVEHFRIPEKAFARKCTGIFFCSPKNRTAVIGKRGKIRFVMRSVFDKVLCQMAMDKGAEFFEKSLVNEPLIKNGKVIGVKAKIEGKTKTIKGKLVIAADGTPSTMAKKLELYSGRPNTIGFCFQYQMELSNELIEQRIGSNMEIYFGSQWIPFGYTWIFPKNNVVTVGCGTWIDVIQQRKISLKEQLDHFIKKHPVASTKLEGAKVLHSQAHLIGFPGVLKDNVAKGCLIVGDASGTVSIVNSEGIWYSMKSGEAAGISAAETLEKGDVSANTIRTNYYKNLDQKVKDDFRFAAKIRNFINSDSKQQRTVVSIIKDQWWANLIESIIDGTCPLKKGFKQVRSRPDKMLKAYALYR
ncbi:geranylgeranyl reductase family protein [archaeon]|nr:geranylgeranyl reductase family protein [archaeon]